MILVGAILIASFGVSAYRDEGFALGSLLASAFALVALLGFIDALATRVDLYSEELSIRSGFRHVKVPRSDIQRVTWEGGSGVALQLQSGEWVKLPDVGNSQSVTNSIRGWLERTGDGITE